VVPRIYFMHKTLYRVVNSERLRSTPSPLHLDSVSSAGMTCNVGYATFTLPNTASVTLRSISTGQYIDGESETLSFSLLAPFNPKALNGSVGRLPRNDPVRRIWANRSELDVLTDAEAVVPVSLLRTLFMSSASFGLYATQLSIKGSYRHGSNGVHTFVTPMTRGLVYLGDNQGDNRRAVVCFESRTGHVGVHLTARVAEGKGGSVMTTLLPLIKTFRFTIDEALPAESIAAMIKAAGISPADK
jgi:hypothetical protein